MRTTKKDARVMVRMPMAVKIKFQKKCEAELIDMSVRIRQLILKDVK